MRWPRLVSTAVVILSGPGVCAAQALQTPAPPAPATGSARAAAVRVEHGPRLDGKLDDAIWQNAQWLTDFVQREPREGQSASQPMHVAFVYDTAGLLVAIPTSASCQSHARKTCVITAPMGRASRIRMRMATA